MKTLVSWNPTHDVRLMDEMLDRLFNGPGQTNAAALLPVDVLELDGRFVVRAAIPGVSPEELDIQIEKNVLSIKGEHKEESTSGEAKIYRREVAYGAFSRSIRLPENLNLEAVDAEFKNGVVTISIPKVEEPKPQQIKVNVRS
ncbi:MAG TPA: Hsp20/alpha crystallin family protein [Fimbriimonadaceae bacterium]|nr:Hsp20/alpha crystallin family protein [Fimbriimonadaceae bacterium]